jgi:uracil-DNA glycosylase family 4
MSDLRPPKPSAVPSVKATSGFLPVLGQRPAPPHRMTCADAMKLGAMCNLCPLSKQKLAPLIVPSTRVENPQYIVVAEGPGRVEEAQGRPLIGPTGMFLTRLLQEAKLDRSRAYLVNVALCRGETDKEKQRAAECCTPRLLRELSAISPAVPILTLGKFAMKPVLGTARLFLARGFYWKSPDIDKGVVLAAWRKSDKNTHPDLKRRALTLEGRFHVAGRVVLPTIHPAFVLRADVWKPVIQADIRRFGRIVRGELTEATLADTSRPWKILTKPENIRRALANMQREIAIDIETDGIDPANLKILCVGFSDGRRTVVIEPWNKKVHAQVFSEGIHDKINIFHNGICFDVVALRADGVEIPDATINDTLVAHHTIGSVFPQRLDHCASVYLDCRPWKIKCGRKGQEEKGVLPVKMTPAERAFYNSCDCVLDIDLWHALQDDLRPHRAIYEHDMALARIVMKMIAEGIGVDILHRDSLRAQMKKRQDALKGLMRKLVKDPHFQVTDNEIRKALFGRFKAPVISPTPTGLPSTASGTLEVYRGNGTRAGRLSDYILLWRGVRKSRTTYIDAEPLKPHATRLGPRVRTNWKIYATPTGRWGGRLQSIPRPEFVTRCRACDSWSVLAQICTKCRHNQSESPGETRRPVLETRVREIYIPRPGCVFVYFDIRQAEAKICANISGDPNFLETCQGDVHTGNACAIFPQHAADIRRDPKGVGKPFRDIAKNFMFGIVYGAAADAIWKFLQTKGFKVPLREVQKLLELLQRRYRVYFNYSARNVAFVEKHGYLISPFLFRVRQFGRHAKAEEIKNHPAQSGVADVMNIRLLELAPQLPKDARIVGQFHDALCVEAPLGKAADETEALMAAVWAPPVTIPQSVICAKAATFHLPIDLKRAMRLSDL